MVFFMNFCFNFYENDINYFETVYFRENFKVENDFKVGDRFIIIDLE